MTFSYNATHFAKIDYVVCDLIKIYVKQLRIYI